jgi:hypothetical protein
MRDARDTTANLQRIAADLTQAHAFFRAANEKGLDAAAEEAAGDEAFQRCEDALRSLIETPATTAKGILIRIKAADEYGEFDDCNDPVQDLIASTIRDLEAMTKEGDGNAA